MRVVLDTNVLLRAARPQTGLSRRLLQYCIRPPHCLISSTSLLLELLKVMHYPKVRRFHKLDDDEIALFVEELAIAAEMVLTTPVGIGPLIDADPGDDKILLAAIAGQADVIATRDNHFFQPDVIALAARFGIRILREPELLTELGVA